MSSKKLSKNKINKITSLNNDGIINNNGDNITDDNIDNMNNDLNQTMFKKNKNKIIKEQINEDDSTKNDDANKEINEDIKEMNNEDNKEVNNEDNKVIDKNSDMINDMIDNMIDNINISEDNIKKYPPTIQELIDICKKDVSEIKEAFCNRNRIKYKNIYDAYKISSSSFLYKDIQIITSGLFYIYEHSRVKSISEEEAFKMISNKEIPISHIVLYTNKKILREISKKRGLSCSNKKSSVLVENIRNVID